tara:strand:+ start:1608 stop:2069 length:462 start_codon:yes stop_codon:yes gene_type:complete
MEKSKPIENQTNLEKSSNSLSWEKPKKWVVSKGSNMRIASFDVPFDNETGDFSLIELSGDGGGLESNINRWRRQLNLAPQSLKEIKQNLISHKGKEGAYDVIKIINKDDQLAFICAIIPIKNKTIFAKLSGTASIIEKAYNDFVSFCSSINLP